MLLDLIENRKSVREYQEKQIPDEILEKILKAGYLAPSWMNSQPWKFILVQNKETKELLSELSSFQPHVKLAPSVIVCVADKNAWGKEEFGEVLAKKGIGPEGIEKIFQKPMLYPPLRGDKNTLMRSLEQVTYAVSFMLLEAKELGVDSCVIGAISNEATVIKEEIVKKVNEKLNLKEGEVIITMLTLGFAKQEEAPNKQRKDFNKIVFREKLGQNF